MTGMYVSVSGAVMLVMVYPLSEALFRQGCFCDLVKTGHPVHALGMKHVVCFLCDDMVLADRVIRKCW